MKCFPTFRSSLKWIGFTTSMLLLSIWLVSLWKMFYWWDGSGSNATITRGYLGVVYGQHIPLSNAFNSSHWSTFDSPALPCVWSFNFSISSRFFIIPLWAPVLIALAFSLLCWQRDRARTLRSNELFCSRCGYNLTGIALPSKCPECGTLST